MKYAYEELSDWQFENLVVGLCQELLGLATQGFAPGPDGGRDAKFIGTAQYIPSTTEPWKGAVIIQTKHTLGCNASFSDHDFWSNENEATVLGKELPRIVSLRQSGELDHYMLVSNRRLTGNTEAKLKELIGTRTGIPLGSICLCGIEQLEMWLKRFPDVPRRVSIDPIDGPLTVSPDELAEVVEALADHFTGAQRRDDPIARVSYELKNRINNMSVEYAKQQVRNYLKDTPAISAFLTAPENEKLLERYQAAVEEFQLQIVAKRKDYQTFDNVMEHLKGLLLSRDPVLARNKRLTRAILFYMYWNCDIGASDDA